MNEEEEALLEFHRIVTRQIKAPPVKIGDFWSNCSGHCQASPRDAYCDCRASEF